MNRPNIIFIFSDQQRYSAVGCNGNSVVKTPNLDALAAGGACFDNAFSSCPLCSPYRGQLITGRYSHANGCIDNQYAVFPDQETLPSVLGEAGYETAFVGKWHLGIEPYPEDKRLGFDYMAAYNCQHNHMDISYFENEAGPTHIDTWGPTGEADLAMRFIENNQAQDGDNPFCVVMSWGPPHWDFSRNVGYDQYPEQYKVYDPEEVDLPPNVPKQLADFERKELAHYYGNITGLDHEVGRVMQFLKDNDLEDNTIICYSSDHGDHLGSHGYGKPQDTWLHHTKRASKGTPYDESIHVPFIMRYPEKLSAGRRIGTMFNTVDIMPTLLGLAGVDVPDSIQGTDLSHVVCGEAGLEPDSVYLQLLGPGWPGRKGWVGCWRGLRNERWVYARWIDGETWLFDHENDPDEMKNLAGEVEHAEIQQELEQRLKQWMVDTDDPFDTGKRDSETGILELGQYLITDMESCINQNRKNRQ